MNGRPTLTAAVLARDEERNLPDCLTLLGFADEVLVLMPMQVSPSNSTRIPRSGIVTTPL